MKFLPLFRVVIVLFALTSARGAETPPLLLISLDGFRWDYCDLHPDETPHLRALMRAGTTARALIPVYPTNTFPNHYSIVTGLYPSHHGIVNNDFFDSTLGEFFRYNRTASASKTVWWGGEPVWNTARKQGLRSATSFWPGADVEIQGMRPDFWQLYDGTRPFDVRFEELIGWLRLPPPERPAFITFYIEESNSAGHKYGPGSPELAATLRLIDDRLGAIIARAKTEGISLNIVVVSDHGMTPISTERIVLLDGLIAPQSVQVDFEGSVTGLRPLTGDVGSLMSALAPLKHAKAYRVAELPAHFHVTANPRNPPVWIVPEEGWEIYFRARFETLRKNFNKGDHGYDPSFTAMRGLFVASGPSFKAGVVVDPVENVHIYNLLCAALKLQPAPNDGDDRLVRAALK